MLAIGVDLARWMDAGLLHHVAARPTFYSLEMHLAIMLREIAVSGLREYLAELRVGLPVTKLAKWKTGFQMGAVGTLLAGDTGATTIGLGFLPTGVPDGAALEVEVRGRRVPARRPRTGRVPSPPPEHGRPPPDGADPPAAGRPEAQAVLATRPARHGDDRRRQTRANVPSPVVRGGPDPPGDDRRRQTRATVPRRS